MRYAVLEPIRVKKQGQETELQAGQVITLSSEKAIRLLNQGKITPVGKIAYYVYSEILQGYLWVVADTEDMKTLRASQGVSEAIYTHDELKELKDLSKESLQEIHQIKEVFPESTILKNKEGEKS